MYFTKCTFVICAKDIRTSFGLLAKYL